MPRSPSIFRSALVALATLVACGGCANGYSRSLAMAPINLRLSDDGDIELNRTDTPAPAPFVALSGDFSGGVPGYDAVGGNVLLAARPQALTLASLTPANLSPASLPIASLLAPLEPVMALTPGAAPVVSGLVATTTSLTGDSGAVATLTAPLTAPVASVLAAPPPPPVEPALAPLITQGSSLIVAVTPPPTVTASTALAGNAVTSVLDVLRRQR